MVSNDDGRNASLKADSIGPGVLFMAGSGPIILCIDDCASAAIVRKAMLETRGYRVLIAESGEQGLEVVRSQPVDLVVSDHYLQGKTGAQIARDMKALRPELPIVLLSGAIECPEDATYVDSFVCKAEQPHVLFDTISRLLSSGVTSASRVVQ
jgi:CheY-like chemotaxis protein